MTPPSLRTDPTAQAAALALFAVIGGLLYEPAGWVGVAAIAGFAISGSY